MFFYQSDSRDPYYNLALEEYLFERCDPLADYFMLWQNSNTIVVGKYQNTAEEVNQAFVDAHGIRVVRRLSGGGAVYHDEGNLNYTFITAKGEDPALNFRRFAKPVIEALASFGVQAEFSGRNDLLIDGKKFCGNAQYAKRGRVMHHGCIMLDSDLEKVQGALRVREAKFTSKSIKSVRSRVTTINEHAHEPIKMQDFKDALVLAAFQGGEMERLQLAEAQQAEVEALADEKYRQFSWNYGAWPKYAIHREEKFAAGLVAVDMEVEHGVITGIRFSGDFFGHGEISELEESLTGVALDESLASKLSALAASDYIAGVSAEELAGLMR